MRSLSRAAVTGAGWPGRDALRARHPDPAAVPETPAALPETPGAGPETPAAVPETPAAVPETPGVGAGGSRR